MWSQQIKVTHQSGFKHDYAIGKPQYLENAADTSRIKYIASLQIVTQNFVSDLAPALYSAKTKLKDLGANTFYVTSYSIKDSLITITIKCYFAYEKLLELNKEARIKNKLIVYSATNAGNCLQSFYLEDSLVNFNSQKAYSFSPVIGKRYKVKSCKSVEVGMRGSQIVITRNTPRVIKASGNSVSDFVIVYNDNLVPLNKNGEGPKQRYFGCGLFNLDYEIGRALLQIVDTESH